VDQAVGSLDDITQQNSALVEQNTAASESLRLQATRLVEAVSVFRSSRFLPSGRMLPFFRRGAENRRVFYSGVEIPGSESGVQGAFMCMA